MKRIIVCGLIMMGLVLASELIAAEKQTLQIDGSTTVGPIADVFAEAFKGNYPDLEITVKKTGSGDGAAALVDGRCDIAIMSRFVKEKEFKKAVENGIFPVAHVVAMDGVCVVVHPSNPITQLSTSQIRDIYKGKITNWKEVGGTNLPIVAISRDTSSGTYETFHGLVMNKEEMGSKVEYVNSNPQAHARVKTTVGAVGYVGIGFLDANVKALKVDGILPSRQTITTGQYPVARPLFMFTNGYPKLGSMTYKFCTFYLTETGQEIIEAKGFIPVTNY
ncbi:MAG: phosphate ABC transporter substrate-binding protein [Planctomycetota bacterium]